MFGGGPQDVRARLVWLGDQPRVVEAAESKDLIVFSGLPPGPYRLAAVTATMKSSNRSWPLAAQLSATTLPSRWTSRPAHRFTCLRRGICAQICSGTSLTRRQVAPISPSRPSDVDVSGASDGYRHPQQKFRRVQLTGSDH
jgi:hypothetical protein